MIARAWRVAVGVAVLGLVPIGALSANGAVERAAVVDRIQAPGQAVPEDLRPLLAAPESELRLVVRRYELDRGTLAGNYVGNGGRGGRGGGRGGRGGRGGGRGGGGRGGADAQPAPPAIEVPLSPARIARLARFDLNWQVAVGLIDASALTPVAREDLEGLKASIRENLAGLEAETKAMAEVMPLVPFAETLVGLVEARIRMEDVRSQQAAGAVTDATAAVAAVRARLEAGLAGATSGDALRIDPAMAGRAAAAVDNLRAQTAEWFGFHDGYDPEFGWWLRMPYGHLSDALESYAGFLRDTVVSANQTSNLPAAVVTPIPPATPTVIRDVPDLQEIIALPQDEMRDIVARFLAGAGGGGRGGRGGGSPAPAGTAYYQAWLKALPSLDFDALSRNAQVDYLFLKRTAEARIRRAGLTLPPNPPRKTDDSGIEGPARGREGLILDLSEQMIPYTPEQLIALADREFAWCEEEMRKASRALGYGDDWKAAIEHVKNTAVPPGDQPGMIRDLLFEAVDYLRMNELITVPQVASESLHMTMMSPEQQLTAPFFLGGSRIIVSYPTDTMEYDARLQSMRGNNPGFSHATAFHEMIPGHNLVGYLGSRFAGYRANLGTNTPFFGEGWPLYWELTMYDLGFHGTPEQKIGALFWRMHRCARIIFSLRFHMGQWSPQESVDFLVDRVGHERDNATAEVRRSFAGNYGPLYQAAYLLGGLQLRGLRRELVDSGLMTNREFHDEIMRQGSMPIALIRLAMTKERLTRDMNIDWTFYGELPDR
jgi:hypothetical protein